MLQTGNSVGIQNGQAFLFRSGYIEEAYFTWSCSPIFNPSGQVEGVFTPLLETTHQVLSERRLRTLGQLGAKTTNAISQLEVRF